MSDDDGSRVASEFNRHQAVNHTIGEYVRGDARTNTNEGYFSILKRGITGTYHLKRYLIEFDFRYNERAALNVTDKERAAKAIPGVVGKRLTYQRPNGQPN
jgi:ISXO2-like transposase domain